MKNRLAIGCAALATLLGAAGADRLTYPPTRVVDVSELISVRSSPIRTGGSKIPRIRKSSLGRRHRRKSPRIFSRAGPTIRPTRSVSRNYGARRPSASACRFAAAAYVYLRQTPPQAQPELVASDTLGGTERVLFDPTQAAGTAPPAIESVYLAPDGSHVAFTTQLGGSEDETLHVVDAATGNMAADTLPHVGGGTSPTAVAWDGDARGFLHTQWPKNADGS